VELAYNKLDFDIELCFQLSRQTGGFLPVASGVAVMNLDAEVPGGRDALGVSRRAQQQYGGGQQQQAEQTLSDHVCFLFLYQFTGGAAHPD
jgi:hypothetical protein